MQAVDLALEVGRHFQKKQTGFVHFCHQSEDLITHDTIPVLENALFALSLFRSRLSDHVLEGRQLIEKLLNFEVEGNFPVYLHEFPTLHDPFLGLRLLPVFFWISHDFSHVIGDLKIRLESSLKRIVEKASSLDLPKWATFRLKAFHGELYDLPKTLHDWGEAFISLQIGEKKGLSIQETLVEGCKLWHPTLSLYLGKEVRRHQFRDSPELSLFDLYLCQWQKHFSERAKVFRPVHLKGALIRPLSFEPEFLNHPVPYMDFDPESETPLWIAWDKHTFVLAKNHLNVEKKGDTLFLDLEKEENDLGVNFFLNHHEDHQFFVNGGKATTFRQKDLLLIESKKILIEWQFSADDGKYFGHILRGNRPSQHGCRGEDHFTSYDWRIAIRTISKGKSPIRVTLRVSEKKQENQSQLPSHASHYLHKGSFQ